MFKWFEVHSRWVRTAMEQNWNKSFTHVEYGAGAVNREGLVN